MTLTEASYWTKRLGVVTAVIAVIIVSILVIILSISSDEAPEEYLTANCACTKLKEDFLENELELISLELGSESEMVFQIETTSGQIDSLPSIINIYAFEEQGQSLNSQLEATEIASKLGFNTNALTRPDENTYVWTDTERQRTLTIDATTLNFIMTTDANYIRDISEDSTVPSDSESATLAINVLKQANLLDDDYTSDTSTKLFYDVDINPDGSYSQASSSGEADLVRIDFRRRKSMISILETLENAEEIKTSIENQMDIFSEDSIFTEAEETVVYDGNKIQLYTFSTFVLNENPYQTNISVYVGPEDKDANSNEFIYRIEYINWPIQEYPCGTYELIAPSDAIQQIQDGEGFLVSLVLKNGDYIVDYQTKNVTKFIVHDISIAYYEPSEYIDYLQPIYVIEGEAYLDNDEKATFMYYVPAINYELVTNAVEETVTTEDDATDSVLDL